MNEPVITNRITVELLSPMHIGSGIRLSQKEFAVIDNRVCMVNENRLMAAIGSNPRLNNLFVSFCLTNQNLTEFLRINQIPPDRVGYLIPAEGRNINTILPFIKQADGRPYFPGSSLKGGLRSALLRGAIRRNNQSKSDIEQQWQQPLERLTNRLRDVPESGRRRKIQSESMANFSGPLESKFFGPDPNRDLMKAIQISDSQAIPYPGLEIAEVKVLSVSNDRLIPKQKPQGTGEMVIYPEVLKTQTRFQARMSLMLHLEQEPYLSKLGFDSKMDTLRNMVRICRSSAIDLIRRELDFFSQYRQDDLVRWYQRLGETEVGDNQFILPLGWGSGYAPKTATLFFSNDSVDRLRLNFDLGKIINNPDRRPFYPFPKSRKIVYRNGQPEAPLGWALVTLED